MYLLKDEITEEIDIENTDSDDEISQLSDSSAPLQGMNTMFPL